MTIEQYSEALNELAIALSKTTDKTLIRDFLESILTEYELEEVASRWALVKQLRDGKTQRSIATELGLSLCKITRGSKELKKEDSAFRKMIEKE